MLHDIEHLKKILPDLKEDPMRIIYTEHFLEKIGDRCIDETVVTDALEFTCPVDIEEFESFNLTWKLRYALEGDDVLSVILTMFNLHSVILISAFLEVKK